MRKIIPALAVPALSLLAAHDLRRGDLGMFVFWLALAALLPFRRAWARPALAAALGWGAVIWTRTGVTLLQLRLAEGDSWERLAAIMAAVLALTVTALAATILRPGEAWFDRDRENGAPLGAVFLLTVSALFLARAKTPFPILLADRFLPGSGPAAIFLFGLYAVWIGGHMLASRGTKGTGHRTWRPRIWALFSAVFFGQLALGLAGIDDLLMTGRLHLPVPALIIGGPLFRGGGYFMPILFGVTVLLVGPAWCSHLCYIGAWDDRMSRRTRTGTRRPAPFLVFWGRATTLALTVAAALGLRAAGMPGSQAALIAAAFGLAGVGVMVLASGRSGSMVHCTTYCPMGLVAGLFGKISPWRLRITSGCTRCGACLRACRYEALRAEHLERGRPGLSCTLCGDCVSACPHGTAIYKLPGLSPIASRRAFLVLVTALHAVFLAVARI